MKPIIEIAEAIARKAHEGQFRRDGITPYITHPARVVARLRAQGIADEVILSVAWLHDVIEDTGNWELLNNLPSRLIAVVGRLTKDPHDPYAEYLRRVRQDPLARIVKIADILDNLSDAPTEKQIIKYAKALLYLHGK